MTLTITVPVVPDGLHPSACWRRTLASIDSGKQCGYAVSGEWLHAGGVIEVPDGTLILAVDKATLGWDTNYRTRERFRVEDATVTVFLAG
jgi:hypothetical protein